jgi:acyl carrier protein
VDTTTQRLVRFIQESSKSTDRALIDADTPIFGEGHLDSLGFMKLLLFVEELRGRPIPEEDLALCSFATVNTMVSAYL